MQQILFIALGGSLGAVARYAISTYIYQSVNEVFPWGTLVVNLSGSFIIGAFAEIFETAMIPSEWRSLVTIGFIGAYTTFSTYSLETLSLLREGELWLATMNVLASNILGIVFVGLGIYSSRIIFKLIA